MLLLWRTNMLRQTRLRVIDEVSNGLSYYDYTFFRELPRLYGAIEDELAQLQAPPAARNADRLVPARRLLDRRRSRRQSVRHRRSAERGDAVAERARACSTISTNCTNSAASSRSADSLMRVSPRHWPNSPSRSTDNSAARSDEPYRRAIAGIYARLAKTAGELDHVAALRQPIARRARPTASVAEFGADLDRHRGIAGGERRRHSRRAGGCARCAARSTLFGFHLAPLDLRQNSDVHERTVAELFAAAMPGSEYLALDEEARITTAAQGTALAAPAGLALRQIQRGDREANSRSSAPPRRSGETYGPGAIRTAIISKTQGVSDMLELALLLKEVGLVTATGRAEVNIVPLFETIDDLRNCVGVMDRLLVAARISPPRRRRSAASRK